MSSWCSIMYFRRIRKNWRLWRKLLFDHIFCAFLACATCSLTWSNTLYPQFFMEIMLNQQNYIINNWDSRENVIVKPINLNWGKRSHIYIHIGAHTHTHPSSPTHLHPHPQTEKERDCIEHQKVSSDRLMKSPNPSFKFENLWASSTILTGLNGLKLHRNPAGLILMLWSTMLN